MNGKNEHPPAASDKMLQGWDNHSEDSGVDKEQLIQNSIDRSSPRPRFRSSPTPMRSLHSPRREDLDDTRASLIEDEVVLMMLTEKCASTDVEWEDD